MSPSDLFQLVAEDGLSLELNTAGDSFDVIGDNMSPALLRLLKRHRDAILAALLSERTWLDDSWAMVARVAELFPGCTIDAANSLLDTWIQEHCPSMAGPDRYSADLILRSRLIGLTGSVEPIPMQMFEEVVPL